MESPSGESEKNTDYCQKLLLGLTNSWRLHPRQADPRLKIKIIILFCTRTVTDKLAYVSLQLVPLSSVLSRSQRITGGNDDV